MFQLEVGVEVHGDARIEEVVHAHGAAQHSLFRLAVEVLHFQEGAFQPSIIASAKVPGEGHIAQGLAQAAVLEHGAFAAQAQVDQG